MTINKSELPSTSILNSDGKVYDFIDSFQGEFVDKDQTIGLTEIGKSFFTNGPKWVESLFTIRSKIVMLFGLKTPDKIIDREKQLDNFKCEPGERLGLFRVFNKTHNEIVLGEDDKHLNFRVSLFVDQEANNIHKKS